MPMEDEKSHVATAGSSKSRTTEDVNRFYGKLVEEVDPFVFDDTFCLLTKKFAHTYIYRFAASKSCFVFGPLNPVRKFACKIISHQVFDVFIFIIILANCVTLAMDTNYEDTSGSIPKVQGSETQNAVVDILEYIFLGIYTLEMLLKIIAKGLVLNKYSYLRNAWNILDFVVVFSGYVTAIISKERDVEFDLDFLRTFRVLRAMKSITILPGLRTIINTLLSSVRQLVEVMALTLFVLMIFALLALQLYMGKFRQRCVLIKNGSEHHRKVYEFASRDPSELESIEADDPDVNKLWYDWVHDSANLLPREDGYPKDENVPCGNESTSRPCPTGYVCLMDVEENYDEGWTNFDNFFYSMLSTFQLLTLDFWERLYDLVLSTNSAWHVLFFILVIFLGSFYLLNLMLAVVAMSYEEEYQANQTAMTKHQKLGLYRSVSTFSFSEPEKLRITELVGEYHRRTSSEREMLARILRFSTSSDDLEHEGGNKKTDLRNAIMTLLGHHVADESERNSEPSSAATAGTSKKPSLASTVPTAGTRGTGLPSMKSKQETPRASTRVGSSKFLSKTSDTVKTGCAGVRICMKKIQNILLPVVEHWLFDTVLMACIIINTILLASEHHNQPLWLDSTLENGNIFFTAVFTVEAVVKFLALQKDYFTWWNVFDLCIVVTSIFDLSLTSLSLSLSVIRAFRLMRVFKLAQSWITMKVLLNIVFDTFGALGKLTLVLLIVLYIFAVLGLQVVGNAYTKRAFDAEEDIDNFPRWHFKNFGYAFMMVFRVICGEWIEPLWDCLKAAGEEDIGQYKCFFIFIPTVIVGNFIILNLFLALLLNSFDTEELNAQREKAREKAAQGKAQLQINVRDVMASQKNKKSEDDVAASESSFGSSRNNGDWRKASTGKSQASKSKSRYKEEAIKSRGKSRSEVASEMVNTTKLQDKMRKSAKKKSTKASNALLSKRSGSVDEESDVSSDDDEATAPQLCVPKKCWYTNCCLMNSCRACKCTCWQMCRELILTVVSHSIFEWFILGLIFASSITLAFEDKDLKHRPQLQEALFYCNVVFTGIFVLEMLLKWIGMGIWVYFTSTWNILDFFIVAVSLISLNFDIQNKLSGSSGGKKKGLPALKALRTLRALRPLRAISRWQGMKIVVNALMYAIPAIINVLMVCLLFWLIFSIMGVQFFKGKFFKCVDEEGEMLSREEAPNKKTCCENSDKWSWVNVYPNFDTVFEGYLTLFQVATFEGWMEAMQAAVDVTDVDEQPSRDKSLYSYIYFVIFIVFGAFFTLNLFIGVIIDNFNTLKKKYEGNLLEALLTPSQQRYYTAMKKLGGKKPRKVIKRPANELLSLCYDISLSRKFEIAIFVMIFCNMIVMAFEHYNRRELFGDIFSGFNSFFTSCYILEALVKIIGLRHFYFTVIWNSFDFTLVVLSILELVVKDISDLLFVPPQMLRLVRVFRIGRVLRLIRAAKGIRKLVFALLVSLPALFNIGALLGLITFIYAILGMSLFENVAKHEAMNDVLNFDTFWESCLMLLRIMTAAGWNDVLSAVTVVRPECGTFRNVKCGREGEGNCVVWGWAILYFVSYLMISYLIVINMYIAIILENFVEASREEDVGIVEDDLEMFYVRWSRYDPQATQFIDFDEVSDFLASLDPPLGIPKPNIVAIVAFNLPIARGNKIHCLDILHALIRHVLGHVEDSKAFRKLQEQMEHKFRRQFPTRKLLDIVSSTRQWKIEQNAAIVIQRAWRSYKKRRMSLLPKDSILPSVKGQKSDASRAHERRDHQNVLSALGQVIRFAPHHKKSNLVQSASAVVRENEATK